MFDKVLIPTDLTPETDMVFEYALGLAGLKEVIAVYGIEPSAFEYTRDNLNFQPQEKVPVHGINPSGTEITYMSLEMRRREEQLREKGKKLAAKGITFIARAEEASLVDVRIVELAEREGASLILMGSHGKSPWEEIVYGSVSEKTARKARVPVLLLNYALFKDTSPLELASMTFKRVLFPTDLSALSDKAMGFITLLKPPEVVVLHKMPDDRSGEETKEAEDIAMKRLEAVRTEMENLGIRTDVRICYGDTLKEILKAVEGVNSIIMSSRGKGIIKEWYEGSISLNVVRKAKVPVLLVHEGDITF